MSGEQVVDRTSERWRAIFTLFPELEDETASELARLEFGFATQEQIERVMASWAAERAKARAPFLALADAADKKPDGYGGLVASYVIRRAAEEQQ